MATNIADIQTIADALTARANSDRTNFHDRSTGERRVVQIEFQAGDKVCFIDTAGQVSRSTSEMFFPDNA